MSWVYVESFWIFVGGAPIRLSTVLTLLAVLVFVAWRFRDRGMALAAYQGVVASLFTLFLFEVLFDLSVLLPPALPLPGLVLLVVSLALGALQAWRYYRFQRVSMALFAACAILWFVWGLLGFPFNSPSTHPVDWEAEILNVATKLLLAFGYAAGLIGVLEPAGTPGADGRPQSKDASGEVPSL